MSTRELSSRRGRARKGYGGKHMSQAVEPAAEPSRDPFAALAQEDPLVAALSEIVKSLKPGDKLPTERELTKQLDVGRTALRDRLGVLEGLGILERRPGSGTYVQEFNPGSVSMALNLGISSAQIPLAALESVRIALERQAAIEAAISADPVLVAYMQRALDQMAVAQDEQSRDEADRQFHQALLRSASNPALTFFADAIAGVLTQDVKTRSSQVRAADAAVSSAEFFVNAHREIHAAILARDPDRAMAAVNHHFVRLETVPL
ncbi:FCD domain-containing protein [Arthrobacter sp. efr-133-TYG-120]|uniref:FadR/GntR family transcriptional regulator n=1 Tax=Arthrobacter sp. efr-133-TYG-120 TaxID=3040280 RepID=UPI00254FCBAE|nr:FCD domain-containing protein [Arthrobacter sp. efr-133-TYG-120]